MTGELDEWADGDLLFFALMMGHQSADEAARCIIM